MKVLIVCSGNARDNEFVFELDRVFIHEQQIALNKLGVETDIFLIQGKGLKGYIKNHRKFINKIKSKQYDLIHAHYGLTGLITILQRRVPVVITYMGSDINDRTGRWISKIAMFFANHNNFVSSRLKNLSGAKKKFSVIPYGVNMDVFSPIEKKEARKKMELDPNRKIALFASKRTWGEKNFQLAEKAINQCEEEIQILDLVNGYTRDKVNLLFNACDFLIMTSVKEGSPQVIKEAMACNIPIVSTDVGDVKEIIENTEGCFITSFYAEDVANRIKEVLKFGKRTNGRESIKLLESSVLAKRLINVFNRILKT
jgi:teichuronic acid biosynthesis glycosyltransferase TuaC